VDTQERLFWCWAAVSASVRKYFFPKEPLSQAEVVQRVLEPNKPVVDPKGLPNRPHTLEPALEIAGKPFDARPGPLRFSELKRNLDMGHPVCALIRWVHGGGHFVAVYGYRESEAGPLVYVSDPFFVDSVIPYDVLVSDYQTAGRWKRSYVFRQSEGNRQ
jgi:hypothetical protein